jgi:hypothetical protein
MFYWEFPPNEKIVVAEIGKNKLTKQLISRRKGEQINGYQK